MAADSVDIRAFIECLKHTRGEHAGKPFVLFPWQREYLDRLYNTKRPDGLRQYRTSLLACPRKQGKTQISAGVGIYGVVADNEPGAEVICVAGDREQASILFDAAKQMVEGNPTLSRTCKLYRRAIAVPDTNSVMKVISSEAASKHGYNPSTILFDEFHVQKDRELYDVLVTATGARRQPMTVLITTAGFDRESICYQIWHYAERVRDGLIADPTFLPCIYAAPGDADPFLEETWKLANPNYGVTIKKDYFEKMVSEARTSTAAEMTFRRLHLNQWTTSETRWLRHGAWQSGDQPLRQPGGRPCWCALDLASTYDTTAFVAVWPDEDGTFDVYAHFFIPEENAEKRSKQDRVPYLDWAKPTVKGGPFVRLTEGDITDFDVVRDFVLDFASKNWVKGIAIDRWNAAHITTQLVSEGIHVVPWGQGFASMSAPSKLLETLVLSGKIRHAGNPALAWQASNVQIKTDDAGNIKPTKKNSHSVGRIDGIVALIMALGIASAETHGPQAEPEIMVI